MMKPPISFYFLTAISFECLHVLDSNYLQCETHEVRLAVKSYTLLYIGNILVFKKWCVNYVLPPPPRKKKQKKTNTEIPCLATLKREIPVKRVQNL